MPSDFFFFLKATVSGSRSPLRNHFIDSETIPASWIRLPQPVQGALLLQSLLSVISPLLCKFNFGHLHTLFFNKSYSFLSVWSWISASRSSWSLAEMTLLFANPGWLLSSLLMLMPFPSHSKFQNLFSQQTEKARMRAQSLLKSHISTWSFHSLSNSNVTTLFMCMGRILIYTSSASFKIASISLKSKTLSTFGNYLWNPLTWLIQ